MKAAKDAARKTRYITGGGGGGLLERELARGLTLRCIAVQYLSLFLLLASLGERLCFKRKLCVCRFI